MKKKKRPILPREKLDLRARFEELEATLAAIRSGEVDALIVNGPQGNQVYSLKGAEQPYRAFIERMGEGAVTLDVDATILYCNQRFADMVETPLERLISTSLLDYLSENERPLVSSMLADPAPSSSNFTLFPKPRKKSKSPPKPLPVRIALSILQEGESTIHGAVVTDLTEQHQRKILSEALHKLQLNQAELQVQYQEVQATRAKLEQANAAKDEFLAALSHELRTPLTPVLLTANAIAVDPTLPPELRADLETIRRNVELEARLIDDLLDITRISRGKLQITPQPTDVHEIIALAFDICEADIVAKQLRFSRDFSAKHHHVSADPVRLQQIFWNLIRNAVKFTPAAGSVTLSTVNAPATSKNAPPQILISVRDSGIGIDPANTHRIFNAFEQASTDITRKFGGLGLGLTITKNLVHLHGGSVNVISKGANRGSTFTVTLPTVPAPATLPTNALAPITTSVRPLRILLVEDHDDTRRNMTRLLTALNHHVIPAATAAQALEQAAQATFDLVISDLGLPDQSGFDLMKSLKSQHNLVGICLSGYGMDEDIAKSLAAGFSQHLTKPVNFQRLESAIADAARTPKPPRPKQKPRPLKKS